MPPSLCTGQPTTVFAIGSPKPLQVLYFCLSEPSRAQQFTGVLLVYLVHLLLLLACKKTITIASLFLLLKPYKRLIQPSNCQRKNWTTSIRQVQTIFVP